MNHFMEYGAEPDEQVSEVRLLLKRTVGWVCFFAALWVAGVIALNVTNGEVISHTIPGPSSELVYVEGGCPIRYGR